MDAPDTRDLPVVMLRPHLCEIPEAAFPSGCGIRAMQPEEAPLWLEVQREAERLIPIDDATFARWFGGDPDAIPLRCFLITAEPDAVVGAISAWYERGFRGEDYGRIHWFALRPAYRGRGLARPALSFALHRLAQWHRRAMLTTSSTRLPALKLYLDYGFLPALDQPDALAAWRQVQAHLHHPALDGLPALR